MSPAATRRFTVQLMVGRTLKCSLDAADETIATAEFLFRQFDGRYFESTCEEIVDVDATLDEETAS